MLAILSEATFTGFALIFSSWMLSLAVLVLGGVAALVFFRLRYKRSEAIANHRDIKVRVALLHILKVANVAEVIPPLSAFVAAEPISSVVGDKAREVLLGINALPVDA